MNKNNKAIRVALYGMDNRTCKTMGMYLKGPCKGVAEVVDEATADVAIVDADFMKAKDILDQLKSTRPDRPVIILSLQDIAIEGMVYVKKPVQVTALVVALKQVRANKNKKVLSKKVVPVKAVAQNKVEPGYSIEEKKQVQTESLSTREVKRKVSKRKTVLDLSGNTLSSYIGHIEGIDFTDPEQVLRASFNPRNYFLSYVISAFKVAKAKNRILQLNSSWKPLIIFPGKEEIWVDADDMQLRAFSGIVMKALPGKGMTLSAVNLDQVNCNDQLSCFSNMEPFLWKVAVWTSKGRYTDSINIEHPVFLKQWPNFTQLLITPHALQIAALLINEPRTMIDIVNTLKIKPQYVFVFISAANVLGLVGQVRRRSDEMVSPAIIKEPKTKSLLSRILSKLRS